jgi:two-component system sensor histidine kinase/response regulator
MNTADENMALGDGPRMTGPVNILLVDDERRNLEVLESVLQDPDYRLVRAGSADEALKALITTDFAVLVLDIRMPGTSGIELAQMIKQRKKTQHLPIIFLTAYYQEDEHVIQGYSAGAVDYLSKPCNPTILRSKVAAFVDLFRKNRALEAEIAERVQGEKRIRELNEQLAQRVNDLAAANTELEAFSYSVSHDLRAPLRQVAAFVGRIQKLQRDGADPGEAEKYLPLIRHSVTRMGSLIDALLDFSRIGRAELHLQNVNLRSLLDQTLFDMFGSTASGRQEKAAQADVADRQIHWTIEPLPEVRGDAAMLRQVFANLIGNAVKFAQYRDPAEIEVGSLPADNEHVVFVRDNGAGFDPRYAHKLFGVFQRLHTTKEFDGTGIGLATVRRIIERHGGRTWAEGAVGQGATISFSLPH